MRRTAPSREIAPGELVVALPGFTRVAERRMREVAPAFAEAAEDSLLARLTLGVGIGHSRAREAMIPARDRPLTCT